MARACRHPPLRADQTSARLPLLDALRTVAAIGVMLFHRADLFGATRLFSRTYLFVDLFFLLSGFVLTLAAEPRMRTNPPLKFITARIARLWPLAALGTLLGGMAFATVAPPGDVVLLLALGLAMVPRILVEDEIRNGHIVAPFGFVAGPHRLDLWINPHLRARRDVRYLIAWLDDEIKRMRKEHRR